MYGIGIIRKNREDYVLPMPSLQSIDEVFLHYSKEEVLNILKQNDSVITENDASLLRIEKNIQGKWKDIHIDIIDNPKILEFSFAKLFISFKEEMKILNILYNHFSIYLKKSYVREEMKQAIESMKLGKEKFLEALNYLNYDEMREIRVYVSKKIDMTQNEIETLNINEYRLERIDKKAA